MHHNQAIDMSSIALTKSTDPKVKSLAFDILTTSQKPGRSDAGVAGAVGSGSAAHRRLHDVDDRKRGHGGHSGHGTAATGAADEHDSSKMPGMASPEEMAALGQATGPELDVMFLQLMLRHHQGGLPMMEYAEQYADVPAVRNLAKKMVSTQQGEATLITGMLADRNASPLPMN
ncbi:DUF305 domain-containing protein [Rhodococcus hoagii]|nr:DUF305 domain-containing protein [Prescottella equi]